MLRTVLPEISANVWTYNANKTEGVKLPLVSLVRIPARDMVKFSGTGKEIIDSKTKALKLNTEQNFADFKKWAGENSLDLEKLKLIIRKENELGQGWHGKVYEIPEIPDKISRNDKYVLKLHKDFGISDVKSLEIKEVMDDFPDLNVGQAVAVIDNKIKVLKKIEGVPSLTEAKAIEIGWKKAEEYYLMTIRLLADMPQKAYNDFGGVLSRLKEGGYQVDTYMASNIIIDRVNERINIIDVKPNIYPEHSIKAEDLFASIFKSESMKQPEIKDELKHLSNYIIEMCTNACIEKGLLPDEQYDSNMIQRFEATGTKYRWSEIYDRIMNRNKFQQ